MTNFLLVLNIVIGLSILTVLIKIQEEFKPKESYKGNVYEDKKGNIRKNTEVLEWQTPSTEMELANKEVKIKLNTS